jgi:L-alanine-DL-glutamate epimerase-like enolase superfamily enzyme
MIGGTLAGVEDALCGERVAPVDRSTRLPQRCRLPGPGAQGIVGMARAGFGVTRPDASSFAAGSPLVSCLGSKPPIQADNSSSSSSSSSGPGLVAPEQAAEEADPRHTRE